MIQKSSSIVPNLVFFFLVEFYLLLYVCMLGVVVPQERNVQGSKDNF